MHEAGAARSTQPHLPVVRYGQVFVEVSESLEDVFAVHDAVDRRDVVDVEILRHEVAVAENLKPEQVLVLAIHARVFSHAVRVGEIGAGAL